MLGENVFLEWNFTLKGNDKVFEFKLQQLKNSNQKDIVRYQPGGNVRVSSDFKGKFDMVKFATHPAYVLFDAETSDEAKYCCEVSTKDGYDNKSCIYLKILGKFFSTVYLLQIYVSKTLLSEYFVLKKIIVSME